MRFVFAQADNHSISRPSTTRGPEAAASTHSDLANDERLRHIVRVLSDNPTLVISGTKLAEEIGSNRSEVWRLIEQLRSYGVQIAGHAAIGYQLVNVPDLLLPEVLDPLLTGTIFAKRVHHFFRLNSSNSEAMQAAAAGTAEGNVYLAEEQTAGRGRGGHSWTSPPSTGIYCSSVLRPKLAPADALLLSLIAGLAVAQAVEEVTGLRPDLRWPNDVMIGDKKFCGILTEMNAEITRVRFAVVGIGINVNQREFPPELAEIATSLRIETGREWSRVELTAALLQSLDREYRALNSGELASVRADIFCRFEKASSYARGKQVTVDEDGGFEGVTAGLDQRGFLLVQTRSGMKTVLSGSVRPKDSGH